MKRSRLREWSGVEYYTNSRWFFRICDIHKKTIHTSFVLFTCFAFFSRLRLRLECGVVFSHRSQGERGYWDCRNGRNGQVWEKIRSFSSFSRLAKLCVVRVNFFFFLLFHSFITLFSLTRLIDMNDMSTNGFIYFKEKLNSQQLLRLKFEMNFFYIFPRYVTKYNIFINVCWKINSTIFLDSEENSEHWTWFEKKYKKIWFIKKCAKSWFHWNCARTKN